jgi:hypothetical protein
MSTPKIEFAPELIAKGERLYQETQTPLQDIAAMMGISRDTLRARIREWGWQRREHPRGAVDLLRAVRGAAIATASESPPAAAPVSGDPVSAEQRAAIAVRIQKVVEREMTAIERMLDKAGVADQTAAEASARALAGIARTLREVALLNKPPEVIPPDDADNDPVPRDIDEFRRALARRIEAFIASRQDGDGGLPDAGESPLGA